MTYLSKILKSNVLPEGVLSEEFIFLPFGHNFDVVPKDPEPKESELSKFIASSFTPPSEENSKFIALNLGDEETVEFDPPQEEPEEPEEEPEEEPLPPPLPPGITITEEDLESRLRESYESGLSDGKSLTERNLLNIFNSLQSATVNLHATREKVLRESEDVMLKLVMMISRKIILREARMDSTILQNIIKTALADIAEKDEIVISLNPDDYGMVTSRKDFFPKELMTERMRLKPDPALHQGSCKVSTEMGTIDADFDSQLEEIYRHILEARNSSKAEEV